MHFYRTSNFLPPYLHKFSADYVLFWCYLDKICIEFGANLENKPVLFLFAFDLLAATKTLFKRNDKHLYQGLCKFYILDATKSIQK